MTYKKATRNMRWHYGIICPVTLCSWQGVIEGPSDSIPATRAVNGILEVIRETEEYAVTFVYEKKYRSAYVVVIRPEVSEGTFAAVSRILEEERMLIRAGVA